MTKREWQCEEKLLAAEEVKKGLTSKEDEEPDLRREEV